MVAARPALSQHARRPRHAMHRAEEVLFEPSPSGTRLTVTHRGWRALRADHPVRHGQEVAAFIRMMGTWWGDLLTSLREHAASRHEGRRD